MDDAPPAPSNDDTGVKATSKKEWLAKWVTASSHKVIQNAIGAAPNVTCHQRHLPPV